MPKQFTRVAALAVPIKSIFSFPFNAFQCEKEEGYYSTLFYNSIDGYSLVSFIYAF